MMNYKDKEQHHNKLLRKKFQYIFGFYSRKKYSPKEAKEILGDRGKVQLKLDFDFEKRLREKGVVPN